MTLFSASLNPPMKVAVFSDVQGNLAAMEVVVADILAWSPDLVVMNGDLVNRGALSLDCLELFESMQQQHGWLPTKGNHEEYVLHCRQPPEDEIEAEMRQFADWTYRQMGESVHRIDSWPDHLTFHAPDSDRWVHVTHGTMAGNRSGISQSVPDDTLPQKLPDDIELFITSHTHKPLERDFKGTRIVNVGSVGSPFDGDIRAAYGRFTFFDGRWHIDIVRLDYDRERADRDFVESGFMQGAGPLARIIYEEWRRADLLIPHWTKQYQTAVNNGDLSLDQAVSLFLRDLQ